MGDGKTVFCPQILLANYLAPPEIVHVICRPATSICISDIWLTILCTCTTLFDMTENDSISDNCLNGVCVSDSWVSSLLQ